MEGGQLEENDRVSVEDVFNEFKARRDGILKAFTTDLEKFYRECDPGRENLCLFGLPSGEWQVSRPVDDVPSELPEPTLGINFARDGMPKDWLNKVAALSDSWLLAVAFFFASVFGFDKAKRELLFSMINDLPSLHEIMIGATKEKSTSNEKSTVSNHNINRSKSSSKERWSELNQKDPYRKPKDEDVKIEEDQEDFEHGGESLCGACMEENGDSDVFWICCDICSTWFHGKCVDITPAKAHRIKRYICPACSANCKKA